MYNQPYNGKKMKGGFDSQRGYNTGGNPVANQTAKSVLDDAPNFKERSLPKLGGNNTPLPRGNAVTGKNRTGYNKMLG